MAEAWAQAGAHRQDPLRVRVERRPSQRVAARVTRGARLRLGGLSPGRARRRGGPRRASLAGELRTSGSTSIPMTAPSPSSADGNGVAGLGRLVDDGEEGDTYNHSPPGDDSVVQHPDRVELEPIERGPVRATVRMTQHFTWPAGVVDGRRAGQRPVVIVTDIQLHAGEDFVRVAIRFDNPSRDHRLRAWFPLPHPADHTVAECAFATVRRGAAAGGPHEPALATYPARRFVAAGGLTLTHEGLLEHELVDDGAALALTLLRATGVLSRPAPCRPAQPGRARRSPGSPPAAGPAPGALRGRARGHQPVAAGRRRLAGAAGGGTPAGRAGCRRRAAGWWFAAPRCRPCTAGPRMGPSRSGCSTRPRGRPRWRYRATRVGWSTSGAGRFVA